MTCYTLDKDDIQRITRSLARKELKFYQLYNLELSDDEFQFQEYMKDFKEGDASIKILNKTFYDIEVFYDPAVFPEPDKAAYPINSIAVYNNIQNQAIIFALPVKECKVRNQGQLQEGVQQKYKEIIRENKTYEIPNLKIEVRVFKKEENLLIDFFKTILEFNTLFLIGFNSFIFDDPYVVNRGLNLLGEEIYKYISEFNQVTKYGSRTFDWPDYLKVDILQLYKPVDQGGSGFGKSLPNYKLNTVAQKELGITKLDLEDLNEAYLNNTIEFLTYNLLDTLLTFKLDEKLQFLELNWSLCKYNNAPMSSVINGRSVMFKYRNNLIYSKRNQIIRAKLFNREIFYPFE